MMGNSYANAAAGANGTSYNSANTTTNLRRWSCGDETSLPPVHQIKTIHIYDFDNTLFASPLPNRAIWDGQTLGKLMAEDMFANGGWFHDPNFLAATGEGVEKEEARGWSGWWNDQVASLCELSHQQKDALSVLLTGRGEGRFADLIKRMLRSKGLNFDMTCLKPAAGPSNQTFRSTIAFKQELLREIMFTYDQAEEIRIYEDRVPHVKQFRDWGVQFNNSLQGPNARRAPIKFEVIQVAMEATNLDPVIEVAEVQRVINAHNAAYRAHKLPHGGQPQYIKTNVLNTGYLLKASDSQKLVDSFVPAEVRNGRGVKINADTIPIAFFTAKPEVLQAVGGIGHKVRFNCVAIGILEDRVWAVRVQPTNPGEHIHTLNQPASIILALKDARNKDVNSITHWEALPPHQNFQIETTVGEKVMMSVTNESAGPPPKKRQREENNHKEQEYISLGNDHGPQPLRQHRGGLSGNYRGGNQGRGRGGNRRDDGGRGRGKQGRGGGGGRGRGGGQNHHQNQNYRPNGYTDYDAGGGRPEHSGNDMFNAY